MKLFVLRTSKGGAMVKDANGTTMYFDNKQDAKIAREQRGGTTVVSKGPDHKLYNQGV